MSKTPLSEKSNFAVAFLAAFLAAGIFKDGLADHNIDILFWYPSYLDISIAFGSTMLVSVYCYALQYFIKDLGAVANKLSVYIRMFADAVYGIAIIGPIFLIAILLLDQAVSVVSTQDNTTLTNILSVAAAITGASFALYVSRKQKQKYYQYRAELKKAEIVQNYYQELNKLSTNESNQYQVLHLFKEIELILNSSLEAKGYQTSGVPFSQLLGFAFKEGLISKETRAQIEDYRKLRNKIAHFGIKLDNGTTNNYIRQLKDVINKIQDLDKESTDSNTN